VKEAQFILHVPESIYINSCKRWVSQYLVDI